MQRSDLISTLADELVADGVVRAAWLGGSDASGRTDGYSDVDLIVVVTDGHAEEVITALEARLADLSATARRYRLPAPTWHGHEQVFYEFERGGPFLVLDLVVMNASAGDKLLERERHGEPVVLLDRDGIAVAGALDRAAHDERMQQRLDEIRARFPIFQHLVTKAIARNRPTEAMNFYRFMTLIPLVELLRIRHCPDRFDFGLRYTERDLPPDLAATIDRLSFAADLDALAAHHAEAVALFGRFADYGDGAA